MKRTEKREAARREAKPIFTAQTFDPELSNRLQQAVAELPEEQAVAFTAHHFGGLKFRAIARMVGEPLDTVRSRYRYALDKLRLQFKNEISESSE
jgi:RNA polymerase sigma factor (sigma-70 family)